MTDQTNAPTTQNDIDITLTLKLSQVNVIIASLDELPHKFSRSVIDEIYKQSVPQAQAQQSTAQSEFDVD